VLFLFFAFPASVQAQLALASPNAEEDGNFGRAVAEVGDVDGDGVPDLLVGASGKTADGIEEAGRAYLFSGTDGSLIQTFTSPGSIRSGRGYFDEVAGIGDVDGDNVPDLLVGATDETADRKNGAGRVYLFSGADGSLIRTFTSPNAEEYGEFGEALAEVGDINGDNVPDLLIGVSNETVDGKHNAGRTGV